MVPEHCDTAGERHIRKDTPILDGVNAAEVMRAVLVGEAPLAALDELKLRPQGDATYRVLHVPAGSPVVRVTWPEVASGFLRHLAEPDLDEWASFVVMSDFDLPEHRSPDEEALWSGVHDASNKWPVGPDVEQIARRVASAG
jgi:hypothetical protein